MPQRNKYSHIIKTEALKLGFDACGISKAGFLSEDAPRLDSWLRTGKHGEMSYMSNHFNKRTDPRLLTEGTKSVISVLLNYFPVESQKDPMVPVISKYAYGEDYHFVVKRKLNKLFDFIREEIGEVNGRAFVDSAPVLERAWAARAGLGWIGKNSMLISKKLGSFVFLGELMVDLELEYDEPSKKDYCGICTECIDACPTGAIVQPCVVDGSKCISCLTIELKGEIPGQFKDHFQNRIFGCDICQDVCPWNRKVKPHKIKEFEPEKKFLEMTRDDWYQLGEEDFRKLYKKSALKRSGYKGLMRNIRFVD
jgi:epoxyqueuosine reductase